MHCSLEEMLMEVERVEEVAEVLCSILRELKNLACVISLHAYVVFFECSYFLL